MRMIRAVAIMLTLTVTITLAGCVSYVDLSDRAIVQAIGIDYLPDKKVYRISMQYFNQSSEGGQNQIDKTQDNVLNSVGEGESIFAAAKNASMPLAVASAKAMHLWRSSQSSLMRCSWLSTSQ